MKLIKPNSESLSSLYEKKDIHAIEHYISAKMYTGEQMTEIIEEVNENLYRGQFLGIQRTYTEALRIFHEEEIQDSRDIIFWWNQNFYHLNLIPGRKQKNKPKEISNKYLIFMIEKMEPAKAPLFTYIRLQSGTGLQLDVIDTYERYTQKKIDTKLNRRLTFHITHPLQEEINEKIYESINQCLQSERIPEITYRYHLNNPADLTYSNKALKYLSDLSITHRHARLFGDTSLQYTDLLHYIGYIPIYFREALMLRWAGYFIKEIMEMQHTERYLARKKISTVQNRVRGAKLKLEAILLKENIDADIIKGVVNLNKLF